MGVSLAIPPSARALLVRRRLLREVFEAFAGWRDCARQHISLLAVLDRSAERHQRRLAASHRLRFADHHRCMRACAVWRSFAAASAQWRTASRAAPVTLTLQRAWCKLAARQTSAAALLVERPAWRTLVKHSRAALLRLHPLSRMLHSWRRSAKQAGATPAAGYSAKLRAWIAAVEAARCSRALIKQSAAGLLTPFCLALAADVIAEARGNLDATSAQRLAEYEQQQQHAAPIPTELALALLAQLPSGGSAHAALLRRIAASRPPDAPPAGS